MVPTFTDAGLPKIVKIINPVTAPAGCTTSCCNWSHAIMWNSENN